MYNLLITAGEEDWDFTNWSISWDRFCEHTTPQLRNQFANLTDQDINYLTKIPALFVYEKFINKPARVGRITNIEKGRREITITFVINNAIPPIAQSSFADLYDALQINTASFEQNRTHWAIKEVDLDQTLRSSNILQIQPPPAPQRPPRVFISYSWDSAEHRHWVANLADLLRRKGIESIIDQWHLRGGQDLAAFMEEQVALSDRTLVICTEAYCQKADARQGGVGYEHTLITASLAKNLATYKFIPIIRQSGPNKVLPAILSGRLYYDLTNGPHYQEQMEQLIRDIHNIVTPIPPVGPKPQDWTF